MSRSTNPKIEHVVVLVLENRSFDHMLGYLRMRNPKIDGPQGEEFNFADPSKEAGMVRVSSDAPYVPDVDPSPSHEFHDVMLQVFLQFTVPNPMPNDGLNMGFMYDYAKVSHDVAHAGKVMQCFGPGKLSALHALAEEFAICDHWFSSLPGPTWPNRFFIHCATSGGYVDNTVREYPMKTIFENMESAGVDWRIYFHDFPQSLALSNQRQFLRTKYEKFEDAFVRDCKNGLLPPYSFIEPRYFNEGEDRANDQHPIHGVALGDNLIADVYDAMRSSPQWDKSLLVITWDEHGGFYDHVAPPATKNPGDGSAPEFDFTRLGVRVPAVLASPYIPSRTVDKTVYDHSSICATLKKIFDLPLFLTNRDARANTFDHLLSLDSPRDTLRSLPRIPEEQVSASNPTQMPPTELHSSLVALAQSLPGGGINTTATPACSEQEAAQLVKAALAQYKASGTS